MLFGPNGAQGASTLDLLGTSLSCDQGWSTPAQTSPDFGFGAKGRLSVANIGKWFWSRCSDTGLEQLLNHLLCNFGCSRISPAEREPRPFRGGQSRMKEQKSTDRAKEMRAKCDGRGRPSRATKGGQARRTCSQCLPKAPGGGSIAAGRPHGSLARHATHKPRVVAKDDMLADAAQQEALAAAKQRLPLGMVAGHDDIIPKTAS